MVQSKVIIFVLHQARPFKNECLENTPINFGDVFIIFNEKTKYVLLAPHQLLTSKYDMVTKMVHIIYNPISFI